MHVVIVKVIKFGGQRGVESVIILENVIITDADVEYLTN